MTYLVQFLVNGNLAIEWTEENTSRPEIENELQTSTVPELFPGFGVSKVVEVAKNDTERELIFHLI